MDEWAKLALAGGIPLVAVAVSWGMLRAQVHQQGEALKEKASKEAFEHLIAIVEGKASRESYAHLEEDLKEIKATQAAQTSMLQQLLAREASGVHRRSP